MKINMSFKVKLLLFSLVLFIVKLIAFQFVHEIDADAVTRVYLSLDFANNPHIIKQGNWPPIFFYIMGGALKIYKNQFITPVLINIIFSILLLFPLYSLLKKLFDDKISFLLCVFFSFSPIIFRMSMLAMSEIFYLFFCISSMSSLLKGIKETKISWIFIAGILMSIAGGIRYESWIIGALIILAIAYFKSKREALVFASTFFIFPAYWMFSSYIYTSESLNSFNWAINLPEENSIKSINSLLRRIWWFPLSLVFAFGPFAFYFFIRELKNYKSNKLILSCFLIFVIFFIIWIINALRGSLLLQQRFSITLFLFSFPFIGYYFKKNTKNLYAKTLLFSLSAFLLAFVYNSKGARPIPRLLTNDAEKVSKVMNNHIQANSGFICDFWNWETTFYLPFATGLAKDNIYIIDTKNELKKIIEDLENMIIKYDSGVLLVNKNQALYDVLIKKENKYYLAFENIELFMENIYENKTIICFNYKRIYGEEK